MHNALKDPVSQLCEPTTEAAGGCHEPHMQVRDHLAGPAQAMMMMRSVVHVTLPEDVSTRDALDESNHSAGQGGRAPLATKDSGSSVWQLVTAHSNGQLQVWDPSLGSIKPVLRIGNPGSSCRSEPMCPFSKRFWSTTKPPSKLAPKYCTTL